MFKQLDKDKKFMSVIENLPPKLNRNVKRSDRTVTKMKILAQTDGENPSFLVGASGNLTQPPVKFEAFRAPETMINTNQSGFILKIVENTDFIVYF